MELTPTVGTLVSWLTATLGPLPARSTRGRRPRPLDGLSGEMTLERLIFGLACLITAAWLGWVGFNRPLLERAAEEQHEFYRRLRRGREPRISVSTRESASVLICWGCSVFLTGLGVAALTGLIGD